MLMILNIKKPYAPISLPNQVSIQSKTGELEHEQ